MSIDYYTCNHCGEVFCDYGYFVSCECGKMWCSDGCAEDDGFKLNQCKLGKSISMDGSCEDDCDMSDSYGECWSCENYVKASCGYCRGEEFGNLEIIDFMLNKYNIKLEDIKKEIRLSKEKEGE